MATSTEGTLVADVEVSIALRAAARSVVTCQVAAAVLDRDHVVPDLYLTAGHFVYPELLIRSFARKRISALCLVLWHP